MFNSVVDERGILLWWQEEGVFPVVKILPPRHTERDTFSVGAVELIGLVVWMKVGCDVRLLCILFSFVFPSGTWGRNGINNKRD